MKNYLLFIFAFILLLMHCIEFPIQYERIEHDKVRLLDFIYEPAEAKPGDTVTVKALFAGKKITPDEISWRVSYKMARNIYGTDTTYEEQPLDGEEEQCDFSDKTSCISKRFVIPVDCIEQSPMIQNDWISQVPEGLRTMIPEEYTRLSKTEIIKLVDSLACDINPASLHEDTASIQKYYPGLLPHLPLLVQLLTVKIRLFAEIINDHRILSDYSVNYAGALSQLPGVPLFENHNPVIDSIGIYKVKGAGLMTFDASDKDVTYFSFSDSASSIPEIKVEKGYSYFIDVWVSGRDTVFTLGDITKNESSLRREDLSAEWFFQMGKEETEDFTPNDMMNISALGDLRGVFFPPRVKEIRKFTIWVQVTDSKLGVLNRSQGSSVAEVNGHFSYSDEF
jgi:hypothetical protein